MATVIQLRTGAQDYAGVVSRVLNHGRQRSPRGINTFDLGLTILELATPRYAMPLSTGRQLNGRIAVVEALQLIGGFSSPDMIRWASSNMARLTLDETGVQYGSYGRRVGRQVLHVVNKLRADHHTRQAAITLWDPALDNVQGKKDYPCTVALMFSIIRDQLHMTVTMRSNDVFLGLPYDLFQFGQLQLTIANSLDIEVGTYHHITNSLHLYERDVDAAMKISPPNERVWQPNDGIGIRGVGNLVGGTAWPILEERAWLIAHGKGISEMDLTDSEKWYVDVMSTYRAPTTESSVDTVESEKVDA